MKLGTKQHHDRLLSVIDSLDATGCFALTELGFGEQRISPACMSVLAIRRAVAQVLLGPLPAYIRA